MTVPDADLAVYHAPTPNGWKITICLEEMGLPYRLIPVRLGEDKSKAFLTASPNAKIPALFDADGPEGKPITLFESAAILIYLAEKTGRLLDPAPAGRYVAIQWLAWQVAGLGPMAGQNGHFLLYAAERIPYAIARFGTEVRRLYAVLDAQLARTGAFVAGDAYSIADIAVFTWFRYFQRANAYDGGTKFLDTPSYLNVARWIDEIDAREPVKRGLRVNLTGEGMVRERHSAADIDAVLATQA